MKATASIAPERFSVRQAVWLLCALCAFAAAPELASAAETSFGFENDAHGWMTTTPGAAVRVTREAGEVKAGDGALAFTYPGKVGEIAAVVSPELSIDGAVVIDGWVRTSGPAMLTLVVEEKDGARYEHSFSSVAGRWQRLRVALADFTLARDSRDENGALDPGQVRRLTLLDAGLLLAGVAGLDRLFPQSPGERTLWLDDLHFKREGQPSRHRAERVVVIDTFEEEVIHALPLGATRLALDRVDGARALHLTYTPGRQEPDIPGVVLIVSGQRLGEGDRLRLRLRSAQPIKLAVGLEERDGSRYQTLADLAGGNEWQTLDLPLADFTLADDTPDENNRLDLEQVRTVAIVDVSALLGIAGDRENRLTLDEVLLVGPAPAPAARK